MAKNDDVLAIQEALTLCGCHPGKCDGVMGPSTKHAIREFQKACEIGVDGSVGPQTHAALADKLGAAIVRANELKGFFSGGGTSAMDDL